VTSVPILFKDSTYPEFRKGEPRQLALCTDNESHCCTLANQNSGEGSADSDATIGCEHKKLSFFHDPFQALHKTQCISPEMTVFAFFVHKRSDATGKVPKADFIELDETIHWKQNGNKTVSFLALPKSPRVMIADRLVKRAPGPFWSVLVTSDLFSAAPFDVTPCLAH
jgi:hypothetical protein